MTWQALAAAIEAAGSYSTILEALQSGIIVIDDASAVGALVAVNGGAGTAIYSASASALEVAQAASLAGTAARTSTGAVTLVKTGTGFKFAGMATMSLPAVAAVAAPLAGVVIGASFYYDNPSLCTKISSTLLPFCYAENKIRAFIDFVKDPLTSKYSPIVTIPTAIIEALKSLFEKEGVKTTTTTTWTNAYGTITGSGFPKSFPLTGHEEYPFIMQSGDSAVGFVTSDNYCYSTETVKYKSMYYGGTYSQKNAGWSILSVPPAGWSVELPHVDYTYEEAIKILRAVPQENPPTAGVSAPTLPVEPIVWPDTPIIIVPDPLGPDYQPIPVTPIVPMLPPYEPPLPLPEYVPDPTPEAPPEGWPEEEPWPTVVPAPWTEPGADPTPETPYIPWPLPETKPDENDPKPEYWPNYPPAWPEPYPDEVPWPDTPQEWPEIVPWPELEPGTEPEWWPEGEPWPDSPQEWPDDVPWPMPPEWPFPWPDDLPYPWPFPYPLPDPSPDPYPDPENIPDPDERVDPIIDPWPYPDTNPYPDPTPDPDPYRDPTQPEPQPEPQPQPQPEPDDPYPTPPSGEIEPPIPPIIPLPFSSTTGLISVYHPTQSELLAFANWLWVTWQDATIDKIWNNPFDGVITLFELYCTPTDVGRKNIRSGFLDSGVSSETISRYTSIDCGSIAVPEYFGNYFDYSPYSKCHIYLPFIGIVELNVDDVVGHGVNVTYRIDEYNGSCIAMITCAKSTVVNGEEVDYSVVTYQFSGNCAVELPLAGGSQAAIKAGMIEAAAWGIGSVIGGVMSGSSIGEIASGMAYGAASAVHSVVSAKSSVQHSGSFGSSYGAMGAKIPYIIVTRPKQIQVANYNELYGYQAHKMVRIGDCTGYLRCREVHVVSPTASDDEKAKIEELLKLGVYVTE